MAAMDRLPHDRDLGKSILGSRGGLTLCDVLQSSVEVELLMERGGFGNLSADRQRAVKERTMGCKWSFQCHTTSNRGLSRVLCVACQQMRKQERSKTHPEQLHLILTVSKGGRGMKQQRGTTLNVQVEVELR